MIFEDVNESKSREEQVTSGYCLTSRILQVVTPMRPKIVKVCRPREVALDLRILTESHILTSGVPYKKRRLRSRVSFRKKTPHGVLGKAVILLRWAPAWMHLGCNHHHCKLLTGTKSYLKIEMRRDEKFAMYDTAYSIIPQTRRGRKSNVHALVTRRECSGTATASPMQVWHWSDFHHHATACTTFKKIHKHVG